MALQHEGFGSVWTHEELEVSLVLLLFFLPYLIDVKSVKNSLFICKNCLCL